MKLECTAEPGSQPLICLGHARLTTQVTLAPGQPGNWFCPLHKQTLRDASESLSDEELEPRRLPHAGTYRKTPLHCQQQRGGCREWRTLPLALRLCLDSCFSRRCYAIVHIARGTACSKTLIFELASVWHGNSFDALLPLRG